MAHFDFTSAASFILITGLVVNSAIYIINEYNNKKKAFIAAGKEVNPLQIYLKAFNSKIIPVFLTITSSVLGLIPFMMMGKEEAFWYAFAAGSVGGLVFSLFVLLVYLPLFMLGKKNILRKVI